MKLKLLSPRFTVAYKTLDRFIWWLGWRRRRVTSADTWIYPIPFPRHTVYSRVIWTPDQWWCHWFTTRRDR